MQSDLRSTEYMFQPLHVQGKYVTLRHIRKHNSNVKRKNKEDWVKKVFRKVIKIIVDNARQKWEAKQELARRHICDQMTVPTK